MEPKEGSFVVLTIKIPIDAWQELIELGVAEGYVLPSDWIRDCLFFDNDPRVEISTIGENIKVLQAPDPEPVNFSRPAYPEDQFEGISE